MMEATGWQPHSMRGFLAGVVRKRLKLQLASTKLDGTRVYRIIAAGSSKPGRKSERAFRPERHAPRQDRSGPAGPPHN